MLALGDLQQVRWECVHFATPAEERAVRADIGGTGLLVFEVAGTALRTERDLLRSLSVELRLPQYFAGNWLSLRHCLTALEETLPRAKGYVLFFRDADALWEARRPTAWKLLQTWRAAAPVWTARGKPFHLVFVSEKGDEYFEEMVEAGESAPPPANSDPQVPR